MSDAKKTKAAEHLESALLSLQRIEKSLARSPWDYWGEEEYELRYVRAEIEAACRVLADGGKKAIEVVGWLSTSGCQTIVNPAARDRGRR